ncbi:hypothetical protein [Jeongeupia naejangsanensis]|uniref:Uncharacterized protein n=1 Tax=Jeongeupia naejangsanensis TaxID=613195 RepID=A0ABS2BQM1_9NEIS|nr:hypothetical protein [Jeongeupia naejangsanensis]MBM3117868.1 hypothetical protein [Jeongeupia naejangsanensis]
MSESVVEIGSVQLKIGDVEKFWVDHESGKDRASRLYYQENNYLGSVFELLVAGVVNYFLARKNRNSSAKKYLHIKAGKNEYCFSEDEVNINEVLGKLKK